MTKGEDFQLKNFQTCDLRVNIYCDGCRLQVKKLLHRIQGVFEVAIGLDNQKVTVVGNVDPAILIAKLARAGKHAELWSHKANPSPNSKNRDYNCVRGEDYNAAEIQFRANFELLRQRAMEAKNAKKHHAMAQIPGPATRNGNMNHNINNRRVKKKKMYNTPSGIEQTTLEALKMNNALQFDTGEPRRLNVNSTNSSQEGLHLQPNNNGNGYQPSSISGVAMESRYDQQQSTSVHGYNSQYCEYNDPDSSFLVLIVIFIFIALFVLKF